MKEAVSVFKTPKGEELASAAYDAVLEQWPVPFKSLNLDTCFGLTHLLICGPEDGLPIILLHGQESSATTWSYNIQALSQSLHLFAIDTPGDIGKSHPDRPLTSRDDYATWLRDVIGQLQLSKVNLVGHSYGGFLAVNFTLKVPELVDRLVLLAPGIPNLGTPKPEWAIYGLPMMSFPSRFTIKRFINGISVKGYDANDPVHEQMIVSVPQLRKRYFLRPEFKDDEFQKILSPCLLLIGEQEIIYDAAKATRRAVTLIPNIQGCVIPSASHMLYRDQPDMVNSNIIHFLAR